MTREFDVAVVGAGVLGLAHAYHLARRGLRVIVFERHARAQGASVRNFGMIWPIGQPLGPLYLLARRSRDQWLDVLRAAGLWHAPCGSLHLAYHDDEAQVLREFVAEGSSMDRPCEMLTSAQVKARFPAIAPAGLRGGLWSPLEVTVDPRQVIAALPGFLMRTGGVEFAFGTRVLRHEPSRVITTHGEWRARRLLLCTGADFRDLAPASFADSGLVPCKLQMMRSSASPGPRIGTMLAAGLTLRHYRSFARCPTLPALARRLDAEMPEFGRYGIHVLVAQNEAGERTIGDSHEYGEAIEPFDKVQIDALILSYLETFLPMGDATIVERWHGVYVKHPTEAYLVVEVDANTLAVTGVGGAGMTLSFGLAEQVVTNWLGDES